MGERRRAGAIATVMAVVGLAACSPGPTPASTPSPTGFSSDAEAFAAAEATYRAYVDAVNARRDDPHSPDDPHAYLSQDALRSSKKTQTSFEENGIHLVGSTFVTNVVGKTASASRVTMIICVDSSATRVLNAMGDDVTPADRQDVSGLIVEFSWADPDPLITDSTADETTC